MVQCGNITIKRVDILQVMVQCGNITSKRVDILQVMVQCGNITIKRVDILQVSTTKCKVPVPSARKTAVNTDIVTKSCKCSTLV